MNERIKQLWEDNDTIEVCYPEQGSPVSVSATTLEKFAELIVKECIGAISEVKERFFKFRLETDDFTEKNRFCAGEDACNQSVRKIETLFGVEE